MTSSTFLLTAAAFERYACLSLRQAVVLTVDMGRYKLVMYWTFQGFSVHLRYVFMTFALTVACILKLTAYFELQVGPPRHSPFHESASVATRNCSLG